MTVPLTPVAMPARALPRHLPTPACWYERRKRGKRGYLVTASANEQLGPLRVISSRPSCRNDIATLLQLILQMRTCPGLADQLTLCAKNGRERMQKKSALKEWFLRPAFPGPHSLLSDSACSNQKFIPISRYIVVAVVRCSSASCCLPVRR